MRLTCEVRDLRRIVSTAKRAIGKVNIPILGCVYLSVTGSKWVEAAGTGYSSSAKDTFCCDGVEESGSVALPVSVLSPLLDAMPDGPVTLRSEGNILHIGKYRINGLPTEEFPPFPEVGDELMDVDAEALATALDRVMFAVGTDQARPQLCGVNFSARMVGERSARLSVMAGETACLSVYRISVEAARDFDAILPSEELGQLKAMLKGAESVGVYAQWKPNGITQVCFVIGSAKFSMSVVDGKYPNFEKVIPKDNKHKVTLEPDALRSAIKRALPFAGGKEDKVMFSINGTLTVSAETGGVGGGGEEVEVTHEGDGELNIALNGTLISTALGMAESGCVIEANAPLSPVVMRQDDWTYVQMPMHLQ